MHLVVCGHVTRDLIGGEQRLGGSAAFAALAASHLGVRTSLLTAAPADFTLVSPLRATAGLESHVVPSDDVTTFELDYVRGERSLRLLARAETLSPSHLPPSFVGADAAYVAPVFSECGPKLIQALAARRMGVGLQGWLRTSGENGVVQPTLPPDLDALLAGVDLCVFSVEDHPDSEPIAERLASSGKLVALTRGARGATLYSDAGREHVPATRADETDPTGAGDVFGVVLLLGLAHGLSSRDAAIRAAEAAAWVVEGPGLGRLPIRASVWRWLGP